MELKKVSFKKLLKTRNVFAFLNIKWQTIPQLWSNHLLEISYHHVFNLDIGTEVITFHWKNGAVFCVGAASLDFRYLEFEALPHSMPYRSNVAP